MFGNIPKINLNIIKYYLKYEQKGSNKLDNYKKCSNKQHLTSK